MPIEKTLNNQELIAICGVLADTKRGLTKREITDLLLQSNIALVDDGSNTNGYTYNFGLNKRDWLNNCLANHLNKNHSFRELYIFIEKSLNPVRYTSIESRNKHRFLLEETNKILILAGLAVSEGGKLYEVQQAKTLDEVDRRVNTLRKHLYNRAIHHEVERYCIEDYLRQDYYDAVFESAKGLAERVRQISGLKLDGSALFQKAFSKADPYVFFNALKTDSEINEFIGLKELLEAIFHLVRNPAAHTPKINWKMDETKALDVLTLISFAHKYLDKCNTVPRFNGTD